MITVLTHQYFSQTEKKNRRARHLHTSSQFLEAFSEKVRDRYLFILSFSLALRFILMNPSLFSIVSK